jgi:hypothetical protein
MIYRNFDEVWAKKYFKKNSKSKIIDEIRNQLIERLSFNA